MIKVFANYDTIFILVEFGFLFLFIGVLILYYFSQQGLLKAIQPQNRLMDPNSVFLQLIPLFGNIYAFIVTGKIADSIRLEANDREMIGNGENDLLGSQDLLSRPVLMLQESRPTYGIGIVKCILNVCSFIPVIRTLASLAWLVCFIIYWVKIVKIKKIIQTV